MATPTRRVLGDLNVNSSIKSPASSTTTTTFPLNPNKGLSLKENIVNSVGSPKKSQHGFAINASNFPVPKSNAQAVPEEQHLASPSALQPLVEAQTHVNQSCKSPDQIKNTSATSTVSRDLSSRAQIASAVHSHDHHNAAAAALNIASATNASNTSTCADIEDPLRHGASTTPVPGIESSSDALEGAARVEESATHAHAATISPSAAVGGCKRLADDGVDGDTTAVDNKRARLRTRSLSPSSRSARVAASQEPSDLLHQGEEGESTMVVCGVAGHGGQPPAPVRAPGRSSPIYRGNSESAGKEDGSKTALRRDDIGDATRVASSQTPEILNASVKSLSSSDPEPGPSHTQAGGTSASQATRNKAEALRLRLRMAMYKVTTNQTEVPLANLQVRKGRHLDIATTANVRPIKHTSRPSSTLRGSEQVGELPKLHTSASLPPTLTGSRDCSESPTVANSIEPTPCIPSSPPLVPTLAAQESGTIHESRESSMTLTGSQPVGDIRSLAPHLDDEKDVAMTDTSEESLHRHPEQVTLP